MVPQSFLCFIMMQPSEHRGAIPPDSDAIFQLFDRVINVKLNVAVPFGLRGTVTGIHQGNTLCFFFCLFIHSFVHSLGLSVFFLSD